MAPETATRMPEMSLPCSRAASSTFWYTGGTAGSTVGMDFFMAFRIRSARTVGNSTSLAPSDMANVRPSVSPKAWNRGSTP